MCSDSFNTHCLLMLLNQIKHVLYIHESFVHFFWQLFMFFAFHSTNLLSFLIDTLENFIYYGNHVFVIWIPCGFFPPVCVCGFSFSFLQFPQITTNDCGVLMVSKRLQSIAIVFSKLFVWRQFSIGTKVKQYSTPQKKSNKYLFYLRLLMYYRNL